MKKIIFLLLMMATVVAHGQRGRAAKARFTEKSVKVVDAAQVPEGVRNAQAAAYPGLTVAKWEQRTLKTQGKEGSHYVAVFTADGHHQRARYDASGSSLAVTSHFQPANAPDAVKSAMTRYQGFVLTGGDLSKTKKGTFYRVKMRQGAKKLTVWLDETGAEVSKDKTPELIENVDDEDEDKP